MRGPARRRQEFEHSAAGIWVSARKVRVDLAQHVRAVAMAAPGQP